MTIDVTKQGTKGRRPSNKGVAYSYVRKGTEVIAKWPGKRTKKLHPKTKAQNEFFTMVQWAYKFTDPNIQKVYVDAAKGTPLMPRDVFLMNYSGRATSIIDTSGRVFWSMAAVKNISDSLDVVAQLPGQMLWRGANYWGPVTAPASAGLILVSQPSGAPPQWQSGSGPTRAVPWWWSPPTAAQMSHIQTGAGNSITIGDDPDIGLTITGAPGGTGDGYAFAGTPISAPGTQSWRCVAHFAAQFSIVDFSTLGMGCIESSTGKMLYNAIGYGDQMVLGPGYGTLTAFTDVFATYLVAPVLECFFSITYDAAAGTIECGYSLDGKQFQSWGSRPVTDVFTTRPDFIGIIVGPQTPAAGSLSGVCDAFSITY